jgi:HAD domain in Swiss Army Knife RNA repair proteins
MDATLLFLDFDGVLHPAPPHNRDVGVFSRLERFEATLRDYPSLRIVLTSSWREQFNIDTMRGFFSHDISERIIGVTPILQLIRQREIKQYMIDNNFSASWIALDDAADEFEPGLSNLVLCDPQKGFDDRAEAELRTKLMGVL